MSHHPSPVESLKAFAIAFITGAISALSLRWYVQTVKTEAQAEEQARHADASATTAAPNKENPP